MPDRAFVAQIERTCEAAFREAGFVVPRQGTILWKFDAEFSGWIGLNHGIHADLVRINPFVGIHCHPIMRLCDELEGVKYVSGRFASFAVHLGTICPEVDAFEFRTDSDVRRESKRLADVVRVHGVPFMKRLANYEALLPLLLERVPTLGGYPERAAAGLYLMGRLSEAQAFVADRTKEYEAAGPVVKNSFAKFALPFLERIRNER